MGKLSYGNIIRLLYNTKPEKREETFDLILELLAAMNSKESKRISNALLEEKPEFLEEEKLFSGIAENLWTKNDVAAYLNKSLRSVQRMISNGELKPINKGKRPLLFRYEDVKKILVSESKKERMAFQNEKYSEILNVQENKFRFMDEEKYLFDESSNIILISNISEESDWLKAA